MGECPEFRSDASFLGWPLVHIVSQAHRQGRKKTARGWIAIGPKAIGGIAIGGSAGGVIAFGGFTFALVSLGGLSVGLLAWGGLAAGVFALGGASAGYAAVGGVSAGYYACGGVASGVNVISGQRKDPEALAYFQHNAWVFSLIPGGEQVRDHEIEPPKDSK